MLTQPGVVEGFDLSRRGVFRPGGFDFDPLDALAHALRAADVLSRQAVSFDLQRFAGTARREFDRLKTHAAIGAPG